MMKINNSAEAGWFFVGVGVGLVLAIPVFLAGIGAGRLL